MSIWNRAKQYANSPNLSIPDFRFNELLNLHMNILQDMTVSEGLNHFASIKFYIKDQKFHREDGPAVENGDIKYWVRHGKLHREDGPAIESPDREEYYLDDIFYDREEWTSIMRERKLDSFLK